MLTADTIMRTYGKIGYDAVAVSANDLSAGRQFFEKSAVINFPWLSANIFDTSGNLLFKPSLLKKIGGITIGIIGITGQGKYSSEYIEISDWKKPLRRELQDLIPKADMVILLSNLPFSENNLIGELFPEIDLIITADKKRGNLTPYLSGNALMTQSQGRGKYLGRLLIKFQRSGKWFFDSLKSLQTLENKIKSVERQISRLLKRKSYGDQKNFSARMDHLTSVKSDLEHQLENEKALSRLKSKKEPVNTFKADFIPIRPKTQHSPEIKRMVAELKNNINNYNKRILQQRNPPPGEKNTKEGFVGYAVCRECHIEQTEFWQSTPHARAYTTLISKKEARNIECLPCHVTSNIDSKAPEDKRITLLNLPAEMKTVGCEVCHGRGQKHIGSPRRNKQTKRPTPALCIGCHTGERDSNFNYNKKIMAVSCPEN